MVNFFNIRHEMKKFPMVLVTFTEEILNEKRHYLCRDHLKVNLWKWSETVLFYIFLFACA